MFDITLSLAAIALAIWVLRRWKHTSAFSELGIPGPKPNLIFGNMLELYAKGPIKCHEEWVRKYGRILGYYYGMRRILLVADPQMLKNIYIKDFSKFINREPFNPLLSLDYADDTETSVLNAKGQKWKETRSILTPTFSTAKMKKMVVTMNDSIDIMLDIFREKAKTGEMLNIHDSYQRLTMDVITKTAFGVILNIQTDPNSKFLRAAQIIFQTPYYSVVAFIGLCFPLLRRMALQSQFLIGRLFNYGVDPLKMLRKGVSRVLLHRRTHPESRKLDLLQLMIDAKFTSPTGKVDEKRLEAGGDADDGNDTMEAGKESKTAVVRTMTDKEILQSAVIVFLAGYETTSTALAFTSYLLAKNPDVQEKIFQEIKDLIDEGFKLEYATVNKLSYLEKVLNESMRIYPPVFLFTNRVAQEDVQYGPLKIPKGTVVQAPCYLLHHDPDYWADPEAFNPERFDVKPNSDGITYFPFGIGPRNCLGMRFAQMEAKLALAHTIYNFKLHLDNKMKEDLALSLRLRTISPTHGINVTLERREKDF